MAFFRLYLRLLSTKIGRTHRDIPGGYEVAILLQELLLSVCQEAAVFLQRKLEDLQGEQQISERSS